MPPYLSKPYPVIKSLSSFSQKSSRSKPLSLNDTSTLSIHGQRPVDAYLKKVVRFLKDPLETFQRILLSFKLTVTIRSGHGMEQLQWELTVKEARKRVECVLDALGIIHHGLFQCKNLLRYVEQSLGDANDQKNVVAVCNSKKLSEEEVQTLTKLKVNLQKLYEFLDCVLLRYSSFSCPLPPIEEIKRAAKKVFKTSKSLKPGEFSNMVNTVTEEDVLCSVLGLQDDFALRLRNLSREKREHRDDMYFLLLFMEELDESCNVENLHDVATVECSLQKMGFTNIRSNIVARWIAGQSSPKHRSLLAWAQIYIENLFMYDVFINDEVPNFPFTKQNGNEWFNVPVSREENEEDDGVEGVLDDPVTYEVPVVNTTTQEEARAQLKKKISKFQDNNPTGELYFHGTHHKAAKSILEQGIMLGEGKVGNDFSNGRGFYLADTSEYALDWVKERPAAAILLFNISPDTLEGFRGVDLTGNESKDDFKAVVSYFRSHKRQKNNLRRPIKNAVENCHYIIGPVSRDGGKEWPNVTQICIKKDKMARKIGNPSQIVGVVFLSKGDTG